MLITQKKFQTLLNSDKSVDFNLIFLGMSGTGKTYWSKKIAEKYMLNHIEFDHLIGIDSQIQALIKNYPGQTNAQKMGNYFSMPWTPDFASKERLYKETEQRLMRQNYSPPAILDLTGSGIYYPQVLARLRHNALSVCLDVTHQYQKQMLKTYLSDPKPVVWGGLFSQKSDENQNQALERSYSELLAFRLNKYRNNADIIIPFEQHQSSRTVDDFIQSLTNQLKT
ncbi:MAG: hypothetical protein GF332_00775 [Candidatus Moranbacteria bacterium]|nr:hypothetical protein [Candidatus Moranbacteria bacterium]